MLLQIIFLRMWTYLQIFMSLASLVSTAQTGHANGADWQEETYQKVMTCSFLIGWSSGMTPKE